MAVSCLCVDVAMYYVSSMCRLSKCKVQQFNSIQSNPSHSYMFHSAHVKHGYGLQIQGISQILPTFFATCPFLLVIKLHSTSSPFTRLPSLSPPSLTHTHTM